MSATLPRPVIRYFGQKWDTPRLDASRDIVVIQVGTPVGKHCSFCTEEITAEDRGLFWIGQREAVPGDRNPIRVPGQPDVVATYEPVHAECDLRFTLGGINHLRRQCSCCSATPAPDFAGTTRDEARACWAWWNEQRAEHGLPPLETRTEP